MNAPRKKPAGTPGKASANIPPAKAKKPVAVNVAQKEASPSPVPALLTAQQAWEVFAHSARELASYCEEEPGALDYERLYVVLDKCQTMLKQNAKHGDEHATAALVQHTAKGCEILRELASAETSKRAIGKVAIDRESWPVALLPGDKANKAAQKFLKDLGVGTKGVMPTASKIPTDDVWAHLVLSQIDKIRGCLMHLKKRSDVPEWKAAYAKWEKDTPKWEKEIRALPSQLNSRTCAAWWTVVEKMIQSKLADDPDYRKWLFNKMTLSAEASNRTPEEYSFMMAERKLKKIADKVNHSDNYAFILPPP